MTSLLINYLFIFCSIYLFYRKYNFFVYWKLFQDTESLINAVSFARTVNCYLHVISYKDSIIIVII